MFYYDNEYTESDWRNECAAAEIAQLRDEARDLEDFTLESTPRDTKGELIRAEWPPIMQDTAGPIGMTCDESPVFVPARKVA